MRSKRRWKYLVRSPRILWDLTTRRKYQFTYDLTPMHSKNMSAAKRLNLLKAGLNLVYRKAKPWSWPTHMHVEVSSRCNLNCPVCPQGEGKLKRDKTLMDLEMFRELMREAGPYLLAVCLWSWGEPLLNPHLAEMIRIAKSYGVITLVSTNGQCLKDEKVLEALISEPPTYLIVAIDGLTEETNSVYRVGGKLEPVLAGVRHIAQTKRQQKQKYPLLRLSYIVMKHNQHEVGQVEEFAKQNGFDLATLRGLFLRYDEKGELPHEVLTPDLPEYQAYQYEGRQRVQRTDYVCTHAFCFPAVFADGTVVACNKDFNGAHAYGRIGNGATFAEVWFGERSAKIRQAIRGERKKLSSCVHCPYADQSSGETGSFKLMWLNNNPSGEPFQSPDRD